MQTESATPSSTDACPAGCAVVLAGGGARGAYEAGVMRYVLDELPRRAGLSRVGFRIFAGTSVGALHACFLAALADDPRQSVRWLCDYWRSVRMASIVRFGPRELLGSSRLLMGAQLNAGADWLSGRSRPAAVGHRPIAGLFDTTPLYDDMRRLIPWDRLQSNLSRGQVRGVALCATEVCSGRPTVFHQGAPDVSYAAPQDASAVPVGVHLDVDHAMASAAIPFVFPAVQVRSTCFVDGGLRRNTPIGPAIRFGADRILVVALQRDSRLFAREARVGCRSNPYPGALFLLGRLIRALLDESLEDEVRRLELINQVLRGGEELCGPDFVDDFNRRAHAHGQRPLRPVQICIVRPSLSLHALARECLAEAPDELRLPGASGRVLQRALTSSAFQESELLSFVMFTPTFVQRLLELGYRDAEREHDRLLAFFQAP